MGGATGEDKKGELVLPPELLRVVLDNAPDFIGLVSPAGELRFVNQISPPLTLEQVIGSSILDWVPDDQRAIVERALARVVDEREATSYQVTGHGPDGTLADYETRLAPIVEDGAVTAIVLISADVTRRKRAEEQLRQAQKLEAVGQLAAGVAHNFNNMLMGIVPNIELASRRAPAEIATYLDEAARAAQRASDLVRQLMIFARPGDRELREAACPRDLIAGAVDICRNIFPREIDLQVEIEPGLPRCALDTGQIEQVLVNCLLNARDALQSSRGRQRRLRVRAELLPAGSDRLRESERGGDHLLIQVIDNGCGMTEEVRTRIFEPFFTTKGPAGSGLGLATTYAIIEEHGGWIDCQSALGEGTIVSIYLPLVAPPPARRIERPAVMPRASREATVALVDDEPLVRRAVGRVLEAAGYRVLQASDGEEGLALIDSRAGDIDVLLLDLSLPRLDGHGLIAALEERQPQLPIIVFTGTIDTEGLPDRCELVRKPVMPAALIAAVERALHR